MASSYISLGKFRARLTIPGLPVASHYEHEVGEARSPEAALDIAVSRWQSGAWSEPIEHASTVQVFRHAEDGGIEADSSFLAYFRK
jgi:hypothetical protein